MKRGAPAVPKPSACRASPWLPLTACVAKASCKHSKKCNICQIMSAWLPLDARRGDEQQIWGHFLNLMQFCKLPRHGCLRNTFYVCLLPTSPPISVFPPSHEKGQRSDRLFPKEAGSEEPQKKSKLEVRLLKQKNELFQCQKEQPTEEQFKPIIDSSNR